MADKPLFQSVTHSKHVPDSKSVLIGFLGSDNKQYEALISHSCIPLLIAALAGDLGKLLPTLPEADRSRVQPINIVGVQMAEWQDGSPTILLRLDSGAELPLVLESGSLPELIDQLQNLNSGNAARH